VIPLLLISACLVGLNSRYDGTSKCYEQARQLVLEGKAIPVCPEQLGGLPTPRPPAEIQRLDGDAVLRGMAKVLTKAGHDVTDSFVRGALETLKLARLAGVTQAILKDGSPSCGSRLIYDGTFSGTKKPGKGVTAALLASSGILVLTEYDGF